jgi:hypothetical protein
MAQAKGHRLLEIPKAHHHPKLTRTLEPFRSHETCVCALQPIYIIDSSQRFAIFIAISPAMQPTSHTATQGRA